MTVARSTKTTCDDRCRKQLTRKGSEAFPLPKVSTTVQLGEGGQVLPIAEAQKLLQFNIHQARGRAVRAIMAGEDKTEHSDRAESLLRMLEKVDRAAELKELRENAPALFLWEVSQ